MLNWINNIVSSIQTGIDFLIEFIKGAFSFLSNVINIFPYPFNLILSIFLVGASAIFIIKVIK